MLSSVSLGCFVAFAFGLADAQLLFENPLIEIRPGLEVVRLEVEFPFSVGERPVEILEYDAPCSCLEARIGDGGRLKWNPGDKGKVYGVVSIGNFTGLLEKEILIRFKDPVEEAQTLTVRVHIPTRLEIRPEKLVWEQGGASEAKHLDLTVHGEKPLGLLGVDSSNENFEIEVQEVEEGRKFRVSVTPKSLTQISFGLVRIRTDSQLRKHQLYQAPLAVR